MPIIRIPPGNAETFTLVTRPKRTYSSSSLSGPTGSVSVFVRNSKILKESEPVPNFSYNPFSNLSEEQVRLLNISKYNAVMNKGAYGVVGHSTVQGFDTEPTKQGTPITLEDGGSTIESDREFIAKMATNQLNGDGAKAHATYRVPSASKLLNTSGMSENQKITLISVDGVSITYAIVDATLTDVQTGDILVAGSDTGSSTAGAGGTTGAIAVAVRLTGVLSGGVFTPADNQKNLLEQLQVAVTGNTGHNGRIFVTQHEVAAGADAGKGVIRFVQTKSGYDGNTTVTENIDDFSPSLHSGGTPPPGTSMASGNFIGGKGSEDLYDELHLMMNKINSVDQSPRSSKKMQITRFTPTFRVSKDTCAKNLIRKSLHPYYKKFYNSVDWSYTNYHCLNFFTGSNLPNDSVLIYPALSGSETDEDAGAGIHRYCPSGSAFTFEFHINPKYTTDHEGKEFHAGTLLHMSSCYAISLVSGTERGLDGRPSAFRMMLQLSHSAEIIPSQIALTMSNGSYLKDDHYPSVGSGKGDFIFLTSQNSLKRNHWHHVVFRWDQNVNNGYGSIFIDGYEDGKFHIPSSSVMDPTNSARPSAVRSGSNALFVGNFFEGANKKHTYSMVERFFNGATAAKRGVQQFRSHATTTPTPGKTQSASSTESYPVNFEFNHPLNAEVHDIKIYKTHRSIDQILTSSAFGAKFIEDDLLFYLPPFFVKETPKREILQTPFMSIGTASAAYSGHHSEDPFSVPMAFGVGGHLINLENYCREFVVGNYPLLHCLTASEIQTQTNVARPANYWINNPPNDPTHGARKRNFTILPCDDGKFLPNFSILISGSRATSESYHKLESQVDPDFDRFNPFKIDNDYVMLSYVPGDTTNPSYDPNDPMSQFVNDRGLVDLSLVTLNNLVTDMIIPNVESQWSEGGGVTQEITSSFVGKIDPETGKILPTDANHGVWVGEVQPVIDPVTGEPKKNDGGDTIYEPKTFMKGNLEITKQVFTAQPEDPSVPGFVAATQGGLGSTGSLTIYNRTQDGSSNQVVFFDVSNLFYGDRIFPGSLMLHDPSVSGSSGKVSITLKDNGNGSLYRADSAPPHASWSGVGNTFYYDGLVSVKSPHLYFFGKDQFETSMTGERHMYVYQVNIPCPKGLVNSSSNPSYEKLQPTDYVLDADQGFVYISGINLHDENMNIVAKASLAQPVAKRNTDHFLFKIKLDY